MSAQGTRCPICGVGELVDVAYDAAQDLQQRGDSREVDVYRCGHEVVRAPLSQADDSLDVERRTSAETAGPPPEPTETDPGART